MKRGQVRVAGHVDAYCTVCKRDVVIPEDTLRCPYGEHDVEPTSLPSMPRPVQAATPAPTAPAPDAAAPPPATERLRLPDWIDDATAWLALTGELAGQLPDEEAQIVRELRQVRSFRQLIRAVLERIETPDRGGTP